MAYNNQTNLPDWSALIPVLPDHGSQRTALYQALRAVIETGSLPSGAKLPPTRDLATRLSVSRGAAVAAYEMLLADGYVEARVGAGTFVAAQVPHIARILTPAVASKRESAPLPGNLGMATPDPRSLRIFRSLLSRHLARPPAETYGYGDPQGGLALRQEVAAYLRAARGVKCVADQIVLTSGSQQAIDLAIRALLSPGDPVWIEDPCYPMARAAMEGAGLRLIGVPVDAEGLDVAAGARLSPDARAVYLTPSHQYPLGVAMTMPRRLALIDWAQRSGAWILEDDYDSEFRHAGPPLTALQGMDGAGRVIYIGTFSKALFPGLRLGYAVLPEAALGPIVSLRDRVDRFPATLAEGAMTEFLREGHFAAHLRRARRQVKAARDALVAGLANGPAIVTAPDQGLHLIAHLPQGGSDVTEQARARTLGLGSKALSPMYVDAQPRQGLVIGFSGFAPDVLENAARTWALAR